jgi:pimeloyl-ACP methyl ester carboxylesterase
MPFLQPRETVLVRAPGYRRYQKGELKEVAKATWELAMLSWRVYDRDWGVTDMYLDDRPEMHGWSLCGDCINPDFQALAISQGLYLEVWRHEDPDIIAVVFQGTKFTSWRDWRANLRWFLRFVPMHRDQYTVLCERFCRDFANWAATVSSPATKLVSAGHSLGGGLAQQFAYALPEIRVGEQPLRVSYICAFDPSPVTGWYSVDKSTRERNAKGLETDRLFEHGEILSFLRLILSYAMPPSASNPAIKEIRVNFDTRLWIVLNHMMDILAKGLAETMGHEVFRKR